MSTPQWQSLPVPPNSGGTGWANFSADPRDERYQQLRASDADRGNAAAMLADAYADGRLDKDEYDQRLNQAMSSKILGELVPVLNDITLDRREPDVAGYAPVAAPTRGRRGRSRSFPRWWISMAVMFNVIWLMSVLGAGHFVYYWPMWPMLGTAVPMIMGLINGNQRGEDRRRAQLPPSAHDDLR
ncbi:DUF1707 SHOCT-like domain-containing protein [Micropruina sp.]|uniref:DUF1707 SHOCT-like domain-containing protein n=1 Tax=Micropruina sp. TaxID=2737536 RepID=UPI0039E34F47